MNYHERFKTGRNGRTLRRNQLGFNKERKDCRKSFFLNVQIMRKRRKKQLSQRMSVKHFMILEKNLIYLLKI